MSDRKSFEQWKDQLGLSFVYRPEEDPLRRAFRVESLSTSSLREFADLILVLSNYLVFLNYQIGVIYGRMSSLEESLKLKSTAIASRYKAGHLDERRALAIMDDDSLSATDKEIRGLKAKLGILRPVSDAVKIKLDSLKRIFEKGKVDVDRSS